VALDRFVRWQTDARPTREELQLVIEDYLDESGESRWDEDSRRFWITFARTGDRRPGEKPQARHSDAFRRTGAATSAQKAYAMECYHDDIRSIEVYVDDDSVDVITRAADDFTNGVAARLAEVLGRLFDGLVEAG